MFKSFSSSPSNLGFGEKSCAGIAQEFSGLGLAEDAFANQRVNQPDGVNGIGVDILRGLDGLARFDRRAGGAEGNFGRKRGLAQPSAEQGALRQGQFAEDQA